MSFPISPRQMAIAARTDDYPHPTSKAASAVMRGNRKTNTSPELAIRRLLHARGLRYRVHHLVSAAGLRIRPDIVFTARKIAVFVDGCFWHSCPLHGTTPKVNTSYWGPKLQRNQERDSATTVALQQEGWLVLRIWEHVPPNEAADQIVEALSDRSPTAAGLRFPEAGARLGKERAKHSQVGQEVVAMSQRSL